MCSFCSVNIVCSVSIVCSHSIVVSFITLYKIYNICYIPFHGTTEAMVAVSISVVNVSVQWSSDSDRIRSKM